MKTGTKMKRSWLSRTTKTVLTAQIEHAGKTIRAVTPHGAIYEADTPEEVMDLIGGVGR